MPVCTVWYCGYCSSGPLNPEIDLNCTSCYRRIDGYASTSTIRVSTPPRRLSDIDESSDASLLHKKQNPKSIERESESMTALSQWESTAVPSLRTPSSMTPIVVSKPLPQKPAVVLSSNPNSTTITAGLESQRETKLHVKGEVRSGSKKRDEIIPPENERPLDLDAERETIMETNEDASSSTADSVLQRSCPETWSFRFQRYYNIWRRPAVPQGYRRLEWICVSHAYRNASRTLCAIFENHHSLLLPTFILADNSRTLIVQVWLICKRNAETISMVTLTTARQKLFGLLNVRYVTLAYSLLP